MVEIYIIMAYDIGEKRVGKVLKIARKYLNWVQNSLLEGDITAAKYEKLKMEIKAITKGEEDSVTWYKFIDKTIVKREYHGIIKGKEELIL